MLIIVTFPIIDLLRLTLTNKKKEKKCTEWIYTECTLYQLENFSFNDIKILLFY